ncbi:hypothetical protein Brsp02_01023 [Brucella sp. NBRC 113783]
MPIKLVLADDDREPIPVFIAVGTDQIARIYLGDDESGLIYSAIACLSPLTGYNGLHAFELVFFLQQCAPDGTELHAFKDGALTKPLLPTPESRGIVFAAILTCIIGLIDKIRPSLCHMYTEVPNQPEQSLRKFHRIVTIFRDYGYNCSEDGPLYGRYIWRMETSE